VHATDTKATDSPQGLTRTAPEAIRFSRYRVELTGAKETASRSGVDQNRSGQSVFMPGLPRILLAFLLTGLLAHGATPAARAQSEGDRLGALTSGAAIARRQDGSEVDAFLGLSRSARIAQVIPDHARACLPSEGGLLATDAQRTIATGIAVLSDSPLGA
jgi:hypothetical protein